ncbi:putative peptidoglycan binding protein [Salana multivorans]|uniref:N-acetylmuramoyl-L-alanine amidase n=1 Tax=Salana multivorans TaxID=120377 RepID=A0A3N2D701_9MICO|nr:N-acetylmuramoyl-L-alanine amidase [Salana multivorans]ROR95525.1 putative peptidoglycan binding protein [Salana multivorans]
MLIRKQLVPAAHRKVNRGVNPRTYITIHETGNTNKGADATAHGNLQANGNSRQASWHWTVDSDEAVQSYLHTDRCQHAGDGVGHGNQSSIAVEICINADGDLRLAQRNAAELVRKIMAEEGVPLSSVVQHNRWSGKDCPDLMRDGRAPYSWAQFLDLCRTGTTEPITKPLPTPPPTVTVEEKVSAGEVAKKTYAVLRVDGNWGALTTEAFQILMASIDRYSGWIDGDNGVLTRKALQSWLTNLGYYTGLIDGVVGSMTVKALQRFLARKGLYAGRIDGRLGPLTVKAFQTYLNQQRTYL